MALINPEVVDAIGIEKQTGLSVLTIADDWDWENEGQHLVALQAKLNAYFRFVESGQLENVGGKLTRPIFIDVIGKYPLPKSGQESLQRAAEVCSVLNIVIRCRHANALPPDQNAK